jgi:hypothetical protein
MPHDGQEHKPSSPGLSALVGVRVNAIEFPGPNTVGLARKDSRVWGFSKVKTVTLLIWSVCHCLLSNIRFIAIHYSNQFAINKTANLFPSERSLGES